MYPIGYVLLSVNKDYNPNTYLPGTWEKLVEGYVLKTITSGDGGSTSNAGNTGSTTLTAAQSGLPSHNHPGRNTNFVYANGSWVRASTASSGNFVLGVDYSSPVKANDSANATQGHTHTAGMPANIGVYAWKRTAWEQHDDFYPIGYIFLTVNKDYNPNNYIPGTWERLTAGYVLKTIDSGDGGTTSNAGSTGPSSGNTGDCTLTVNQIPSHSHSFKEYYSFQRSSTGSVATGAAAYGNASSYSTNNTGGGQAHNHSLNNHTHTAGMPANIGVYAWKRTA